MARSTVYQTAGTGVFSSGVRILGQQIWEGGATFEKLSKIKEFEAAKSGDYAILKIVRTAVSKIKGKIKVGKGYLFQENNQRVIFLESDNGPMLMIWNNGDKPVGIAKELAGAIGPKSEVINAEGVCCDQAASLLLQPENYYFISNPKLEVIAKWNNSGEVLYARNAKLKLQNQANGVYRRGKLLDDAMNLIQPQTVRWQAIDRKDTTAKGRFAAGFSNSGFELLVEVEDKKHCMEADDIKVWEFDSIQFAFDTAGQGVDFDRMEFAAALKKDGSSALWKVFAPMLKGDLPADFTAAGNRVENGRCLITHRDGKTIYKIKINFSELYPLIFQQHPRVRFGLLINNNDGQKRLPWTEWGGGIGGAKNPCAYGNLTPELKRHRLVSSDDLKNKGWKKDYNLEFFNSDGVSAIKVGGSPICSGVISPWVSVVPGGRYRIAFEAKGDARIQAVVNSATVKRIDLMPPTLLNSEWKKFDLYLYIPLKCLNLSISCFAWQQPNRYFEIRNFVFEAI